MKERFPRVVGGFSVGFLLGGLLGIPLLALLGSTEDLLLGATVAQLAFLGLLLVTERRFPEVRSAPVETSQETTRPSARTLFASGLVLLLLVYQVLSAMGSWLVDYVLFNRAHAHYSGNDLTRLLSWYTAVLNLADILFLALLAGPLMRRFGLRLGLVLNPAVVAALLAVDGRRRRRAGRCRIQPLRACSRDSPLRHRPDRRHHPHVRQRLVPGRSDPGPSRRAGRRRRHRRSRRHRRHGRGAAAHEPARTRDRRRDRLRCRLERGLDGKRRGDVPVVHTRTRRRDATPVARRSPDEVAEDDVALQALLRSDDARDVRLALDLLPGIASPASTDALQQASEHADPKVRLRALVQLAAGENAQAAEEAAALATELARSADPAERSAAASALGPRRIITDGQGMLIGLLDDPDPMVRAAALDSVVPADAAEREVVRRVVAALEEPRTAGSATVAVRRLGDSAVPLLAAALAGDGASRRPPLIRAAANAAMEHGSAVIEPALRDRDRVVVLAALEALDAADGAGVVPPDLLDAVFDDAAEHASRTLNARVSLAASDGSLRRALEDESDLARRLVIAVLALRHGDRVRDAVRVVERADGQRRALGVEALDVIISREEAAIAHPARSPRRHTGRAGGRATARRTVCARLGRVDRGYGR